MGRVALPPGYLINLAKSHPKSAKNAIKAGRKRAVLIRAMVAKGRRRRRRKKK